MEHIKFYDNPENISPKEILEKMRTLGYGIKMISIITEDLIKLLSK